MLEDANTTRIKNNVIANNRADGINLAYTHDTTIKGNKILQNNENGLNITNGKSTVIQGNLLRGNNGWYGMVLHAVRNTNIQGNTLRWSAKPAFTTEGGIYLTGGENNIIKENHIRYNHSEYGLYLSNTSFNTISRNDIAGSRYGIYLKNLRGSNTRIVGNLLQRNKYGLYVRSGKNLGIKENSIRENKVGIHLGERIGGTPSFGYYWVNTTRIERNNLVNNLRRGVEVRVGKDNIIKENNFLSNHYGAYFYEKTRNNQVYRNNFMENTEHAWDVSGKNLFNSSDIGNYWDTYVGTDADGDGIGEAPYNIFGGGGSQDFLPAVQPFQVADTTAPSLTVVTPKNGATYRASSVVVNWTGTDSGSGIDRYAVRIDGGSWLRTGKASSYLLTGLDDGEHTIEVKAVDVRGNVGTASTTFTINTSPLFGLGWWAELGIALGIVGLIAVVAFYIKKKR